MFPLCHLTFYLFWRRIVTSGRLDSEFTGVYYSKTSIQPPTQNGPHRRVPVVVRLKKNGSETILVQRTGPLGRPQKCPERSPTTHKVTGDGETEILQGPFRKKRNSKPLRPPYRFFILFRVNEFVVGEVGNSLGVRSGRHEDP